MKRLPTSKPQIALVDFEATCSKDHSVPRHEMEIIEIGAILIDPNLTQLGEFSSFIKPVRNPQLTRFCTELTTITQDQVDKAEGFKRVLHKFENEFIQDRSKVCFASWGYYDKNQLRQDCNYHNAEFPFDSEHINLKKWVANKLNLGKPRGIGSTLAKLGLEFEGTSHRGIDDVRNVLRILKEIQ